MNGFVSQQQWRRPSGELSNKWWRRKQTTWPRNSLAPAGPGETSEAISLFFFFVSPKLVSIPFTVDSAIFSTRLEPWTSSDDITVAKLQRDLQLQTLQAFSCFCSDCDRFEHSCWHQPSEKRVQERIVIGWGARVSARQLSLRELVVALE